MRERVRLIWGKRKAEYFRRDIWTGVMGLKELGKLGFRRREVWAGRERERMLKGRDPTAWPRPLYNWDKVHCHP
jgi:hypothetical protein